MGRPPARDERGIIASWMARIVITTALVGVILFDAGSIAVNFFGLDATADDVAIGASNFAKNQPGTVSPVAVEQQAKQLARDADARLTDFTYDEESGNITLTLKREANTLIVSKISAIEDWGKATAESRASSD